MQAALNRLSWPGQALACPRLILRLNAGARVAVRWRIERTRPGWGFLSCPPGRCIVERSSVRRRTFQRIALVDYSSRRERKDRVYPERTRWVASSAFQTLSPWFPQFLSTSSAKSSLQFFRVVRSPSLEERLEGVNRRVVGEGPHGFQPVNEDESEGDYDSPAPTLVQTWREFRPEEDECWMYDR